MSRAKKNEKNTIKIFGPDETIEERSFSDLWSKRKYNYGSITKDVFIDEIEKFLDNFENIFSKVPNYFGQYNLEQITLSAEVSAKGSLSLLGTGGEAGGKGGITFTFNKKVEIQEKE